MPPEPLLTPTPLPWESVALCCLTVGPVDLKRLLLPLVASGCVAC